jgi:hypothetical protein
MIKDLLKSAWKVLRTGSIGAVLLLTAHCGGSTSGSGGVTVTGRLIAENNAAVAGVTVTDLSTGDADITDETGTFGLLSPAASTISLLFEGQGLSTQAALTNLPADTSSITATFRARLAINSVQAEDVIVEQRPAASSSSSSRSTSAGSSSSAGTSSTASSASLSSDDNSSSSDSSDDEESSSASSEDDSSSSSSDSESSRVDREGVIQALTSQVVRVGGIDFVPQASTEYKDGDGERTTLAAFSVGDQVKARGETQGSIVALQRLEIDN